MRGVALSESTLQEDKQLISVETMNWLLWHAVAGKRSSKFCTSLQFSPLFGKNIAAQCLKTLCGQSEKLYLVVFPGESTDA